MCWPPLEDRPLGSCAGPGWGLPVLDALLLWGGQPETEPSPLGDTLLAEVEQVTLEVHLWVLLVAEPWWLT